MKRRSLRGPVRPARALLVTAALLGLAGTGQAQHTPLALHPENPHYFLLRGRPAFLITSGEHYGAVLNADFDFVPYLDELQARGFNLTRTFSGVYREVPGSFQIKDNTLAPAPDRYVSPWARTDKPGAADGGAKFDLDRWNDAYFQRLKEFCTQAARRGVVVELVLFCPFYEDGMWNVSPLNARNNVNGVGGIPRTEVYTLKHPAMVARHEALVRKVAATLRECDCLYYEICNEPYFGGVTLDWQARIAETIAAAEPPPGPKHLIAQNIANGKARVERPNPAVSILNFHYATPPDAVGLNYDLDRVIGDDETGFRGVADRAYRAEAWEFLLAGGALFDNLDYSFTADHEDGSAHVSAPTPGGGGPALRRQLGVLREFLAGFDFIHMRPDPGCVAEVRPKALAPRVRALAGKGKAYAVYVGDGSQVTVVLAVPPGRYRAEWVNPRTGAIDRAQDCDCRDGRVTLESPGYVEDVALRLLARP
jgi:hypothetical protein